MSPPAARPGHHPANLALCSPCDKTQLAIVSQQLPLPSRYGPEPHHDRTANEQLRIEPPAVFKPGRLRLTYSPSRAGAYVPLVPSKAVRVMRERHPLP